MKIFDGEKAGLIVIVCAAFFLCLSDIDVLLPYFEFSWDETGIVNTSLNMIKEKDLNPHRFIYGSFIFYFTAIVYCVYFGVRALLGPSTFSQLVATASFSSDNFILLYIGRVSSIVFCVINIVVVYFIGRKLWNKKAGYIAAFSLVINPMYITQSQLFKTEYFLLFFILVTFYFSLLVFHSGRPKYYILAGIFSGLTISTKYQFAVIFPVLTAHFLRTFRESHLNVNNRSRLFYWAKSLLDMKCMFFIYVAAMVFAFTSPFVLIDFRTSIAHIFSQTIGIGNIEAFRYFPDSFFYQRYIYQLLILYPVALGLPIYLSAIMGSYFLIKTRTKSALIIISFPILYFFISSSSTYVTPFHHHSPMIPFAALLGAYFMYVCISHKKRFCRTSGWVLLAAACVWFGASWVMNPWKALFSTHEKAASWTEKNIPREDRVYQYYGFFQATEYFSFPNGKNIHFYQHPSEDGFLDFQAQWAILTYCNIFNDPGFREKGVTYQQLFRSLISGSYENYRLVKEFRPPRSWNYLMNIIAPDLNDLRITVFKRYSEGPVSDIIRPAGVCS